MMKDVHRRGRACFDGKQCKVLESEGDATKHRDKNVGCIQIASHSNHACHPCHYQQDDDRPQLWCLRANQHRASQLGSIRYSHHRPRLALRGEFAMDLHRSPIATSGPELVGRWCPKGLIPNHETCSGMMGNKGGGKVNCGRDGMWLPDERLLPSTVSTGGRSSDVMTTISEDISNIS